METYVVGVDLSPASVDALDWAVSHAASRDARVVAVHAFDYLRQVGPDGRPTFDPEYSRDDAARHLDVLIARSTQDRDASVSVEARVVVAKPAEVLLEVAAEAGADLIVVGSRGTGGFRGLLMGSVSQQVAMHAPCPVVVHRTRSS